MKFLLAFFFGLSAAMAQTPLSDWELDSDKDDVQISYRKIIVGDTFKTRQMKVAFDIKAASDVVFNNFYSANEFQQWSANAEKCELIKKHSEDHWEVYCLYDAPWPFKTRDMQTDYTFEESNDILIIKASPVSQEMSEKEGVVRMSQYIGEWKFYKTDGKITSCEFISYTLTKPMMFTFIQDPVIQSIMIESVTNLKERVIKK